MNDLYNAADPRQIRAAAKAARAVDAEYALVISNLMSSSAGRAWIHSLLGAAHIFSTSFNQSGLGMAFAEGERNIGLRILGAITAHCPDQYLQMMNEARDREHGRRTSSNDGGPSGPTPDPGRDIVGSVDFGAVESEYDPGPE